MRAIMQSLWLCFCVGGKSPKKKKNKKKKGKGWGWKESKPSKGMFKNALIFSFSMEERGEQDHREARFNMAVATLQRIHISLEKIRWGFEFLNGITKQRFHINQVKILFMNATPLLEEKLVKKYETEVDGLKLKSKVARGRPIIFYDIKLEARLFELVREWTLELKKYFMPSKVDDGDDY